MALLAATQAYQSKGVMKWDDGASCLISNEMVGDGNSLWIMLLPTADLQHPTDTWWSEDSGAALTHSRLPVYSVLGQLYGFQLSSDLIPVLFEAWQAVDRCLEPHPRIELRLRRDPEVEDLTMLFAIVHTASEPERVFQGLKDLDAGWLSLQSPWIQEMFNVDVEFD